MSGDESHDRRAAHGFTVFISHCHDEQQSRELADEIRKLGVEVIHDADQLAVPEPGWTRWAEQGLRRAHYVLCFCTLRYLQRIHGTTRCGALTEWRMISARVERDPSPASDLAAVVVGASERDKQLIRSQLSLLFGAEFVYPHDRERILQEIRERARRFRTSGSEGSPRSTALVADGSGSRSTRAPRTAKKLPASPPSGARPRAWFPHTSANIATSLMTISLLLASLTVLSRSQPGLGRLAGLDDDLAPEQSQCPHPAYGSQAENEAVENTRSGDDPPADLGPRPRAEGVAANAAKTASDAPVPAFIEHGNFAMTTESFHAPRNRGTLVERILGPGYRPADWSDIVALDEEGGIADIVALMAALKIGAEPSSPFITLHGEETLLDPNRKRLRDYYLIALNGHDPRHGDVHAHLGGYLLGVGSWPSTRPILAIRREPEPDFYEPFRGRRLAERWHHDNEDIYPADISVRRGHLLIDRPPGGTAATRGGVFVELDLPITARTVISFDVSELAHHLSENSRRNPRSRASLTIQLDLETAEGREVELSYAHGHYLEDGTSEDEGRKQHERHISPLLWHRGLRHRIRDTWSDATRLRKIAISGFGLRYEVEVDNLRVYELPEGWTL